MDMRRILLLVCISVTIVDSEFTSFKNLKSYVKIFKFDGLSVNETGNELWSGLFRDCDKKVTFSCIQKNAYSYLDNVFIERDNITVFDGLVLTKNDLDYGTCRKTDNEDHLDENLVGGSSKIDCQNEETEEDKTEEEDGRKLEDELETPLEEVSNALRKKTVKFLATRNYELQLPEFFFEGATVKISPREVDENGALLRLDFGQRAVENQGRIFKKIRKFIQNKLLTSFLALLLIIKLIKVKFMFIIPFLFGVGTAKKLFLKLLLFFIPAFAHIFKLCSSYYSSHSTKFHHHHHQIAHHHHHVPVPVPVPTYYDHHHHHHEEDFDGYDYAHPHIQYRKDVEELKEWGIEPYEEPYQEVNQHIGVASVPVRPQIPPNVPGPLPSNIQGVVPGPLPSSMYSGPYGLPQYAPNVRPISPVYPEKRPTNPISNHAHNLAYSGYLDETKLNRRVLVQPQQQQQQQLQQQNPTIASFPNVPVNPSNLVSATASTIGALKNSYAVYPQPNVRQVHVQGQRTQQPVAGSKSTLVQRQAYDDEFYGPIIGRLEEIFGQLRFYEEACKERLVCSMYKTPAVYSPHSNLVSNELSRDPQELKRGVTESTSSQKFHRYLSAARLGQDGGDCLRTYPCHINTE